MKREHNSMSRSLLKLIVVLVWTVIIHGASGQNFEVASVKPNENGVPRLKWGSPGIPEQFASLRGPYASSSFRHSISRAIN